MAVLMTPQVAQDIAQIIRDHYGAMAAVLYGRDAVTPEIWDEAVRLGLVDSTASIDAIAEGLHAYGALLAHKDQAGLHSRYGMTLDAFKEEIQRNPVPQTRVEHHAAEYANKRAAENIVGLGARAATQAVGELRATAGDGDRGMRSKIRDVIAARFGDPKAALRIKDDGIADGMGSEFFANQFRSTINRQISDIGHLIKDWKRDLHRVVLTESTAAVHEGLTESWDEQTRAAGRATNKILVFRVPRADACKHCVRLYLDGGIPRIFNMEQLRGNGSNYGIKRSGWLPIAGPTHPYCSCPIHRVPAILAMPHGWRHGDPAPSIIGVGGQIVL